MVNLDEIGAKLTAGRRPGQELSIAARAAIIGAVAAGASQSAVARAFRVERTAVYRILQRFQSSTTVESKPRTGRPEVLTRREKRFILQLAKRFPRHTTQMLTNSIDGRISRSTVRRVLREQRVRKWRAQKRIPLSKAVAMDRYSFACFWLENIETLIRTIFTDESSCQNNSSSPTAWVFRFPSQKWDKSFVNLQNHGKGTISIMIWGGIWKGGRTDLVVMERDYQPPQKGGYSSWSYQQALKKGLLPIYDGTRHFQQDNARVHTSASSTTWLLEHAVEVLDGWPAHSPDLNPIEHMWALLKQRMKQQYPDVWLLKKNQLDVAEFTRCLRVCWWAIDQAQIDGLLDSIPRRLAAVKKARGWYTKY